MLSQNLKNQNYNFRKILKCSEILFVNLVTRTLRTKNPNPCIVGNFLSVDFTKV